MSFQEHLFAFELDGRKCEVYVWSHNEEYWGAGATDKDGAMGKDIHLKKARYSTMKNAA